MKFSIKTDHPEKQRSDVLVFGVYDSLKVAYDKPILSTSTINYIASILKHGDMSGKKFRHYKRVYLIHRKGTLDFVVVQHRQKKHN